MSNTQKIIPRAGSLCLLFIITACGAGDGTAVIGTWKEVNQERYLTIEKIAETNDGSSDKASAVNSTSTEQYRAIIYAPNRSISVSGQAQTTMNHLSMPARLQDGIMMLMLEAGDIAVLYHPNSQQIVLNGTDTYQKVPENMAQLKLDTVRDTNH